MAKDSNIEWTRHTTNLWWGCSKVHTGCKNCYAEHLSDVRYKNNLWGEYANRRAVKSAFPNLSSFQKEAEALGEKHTVFVGSMMDIFERAKSISPPTSIAYTTGALRSRLFSQIINGEYPNLIFLFLTKRPQNIVNMIPSKWLNNTPKNVWFGTSVSNMETWSKAESLALVSQTNLFLSVEPQVGLIDGVDLTRFHWVIQGGESGPKKRPFNLDWAYTMQEMCKNAGVPYFFKQIDKIQPIPENLMNRQLPIF